MVEWKAEHDLSAVFRVDNVDEKTAVIVAYGCYFYRPYKTGETHQDIDSLARRTIPAEENWQSMLAALNTNEESKALEDTNRWLVGEISKMSGLPAFMVSVPSSDIPEPTPPPEPPGYTLLYNVPSRRENCAIAALFTVAWALMFVYFFLVVSWI